MPDEASLLRRGWSIVLSKDKSFQNFLSKDGSTMEETNDLIGFIKKNKNNKLVLITKVAQAANQIGRLVANRLQLEMGYRPSIEVLVVGKSASNHDKVQALKERYTTNKINFFQSELQKEAGMPIPMHIKEKASQASEKFKEAIKILTHFLENLQKNVSAYETIQDKVEEIPKTKEQYRESIKRNISVIQKHLHLVKQGVEIMDGIKDISTTTQINISVINASKKISEGAEDIFNLIDKMDSPDFYMILSDKTNEFEHKVDEAKIVIGRMINYINSDILGIVVISD